MGFFQNQPWYMDSKAIGNRRRVIMSRRVRRATLAWRQQQYCERRTHIRAYAHTHRRADAQVARDAAGIGDRAVGRCAGQSALR
ncbi:hypothetical protein IWW45_009566 [Coemansia sp. RSA 485]|nr:hypothetical protein IWW45_009566 [Coemansia sp. RSA 485]